MRVALLYGHFASNFGDVAITSASCSLLANVVGQENVRVIIAPLSEPAAQSKDWLESVHGPVDCQVVEDRLVNALKGRESQGPDDFEVFGDALLRPAEFLERNGLGDTDVLVFNSGEHLFSGGDAREDFVLTGRLALLLAGAAVGRKIVCLPSTIGPFHSHLSEGLARTFVKACSAIAVRETASLDRLGEMDIEPDAHGICALLDPAFFLDLPETRQPGDADPALISVGIRLDGFGLRVGGSASSEALRDFRKDDFRTSKAVHFYTDFCCRILKGSDKRIQCLIQTDRDLEITEAVMRFVEAREPSLAGRITIEQPADLQAFLRVLARGSFTVASRFHALIFSLLIGRPMLGVYFPEHGHKIPGLMDLFKVPELAFDGSKPGAGDAVETVQSIQDNPAEFTQAMNQRLAELSEATTSWLAAELVPTNPQPIAGASLLGTLLGRFRGGKDRPNGSGKGPRTV